MLYRSLILVSLSLFAALPASAQDGCSALFSSALIVDGIGRVDAETAELIARIDRLPIAPRAREKLHALASNESTRNVFKRLAAHLSASELEGAFKNSLSAEDASSMRSWAYEESVNAAGAKIRSGQFANQLVAAAHGVRKAEAELGGANEQNRAALTEALQKAQKRKRVVEDQIIHFGDQIEMLRKAGLLTPELEAALANHDLGKAMPARLPIQAQGAIGLLKLALGRVDAALLSDPQLLPQFVRDKFTDAAMAHLRAQRIDAAAVVDRAEATGDPIRALAEFGLLDADGKNVVMPLRNFIGEGLAHSWNTMEILIEKFSGADGRVDPAAMRVLLLGIGHDQFYIPGSFGYSNFTVFMGIEYPRFVLDEAKPMNLTDRTTISTINGLRKLISEDVSIENALQAFRANAAQVDWNEHNLVNGDHKLQLLVDQAHEVNRLEQALFEATHVKGNVGFTVVGNVELRFNNALEFAGVGGDDDAKTHSVAQQFIDWF